MRYTKMLCTMSRYLVSVCTHMRTYMHAFRGATNNRIGDFVLVV